MQVRQSIQKTKRFFHRTLQNLRSLFIEGYRKLPKTISFNPFSCNGNNVKDGLADDQYYNDFCNEWECDLEKAMKRKNNNGTIMVSKQPTTEEDKRSESSSKPAKEATVKEEKHKKSSHLGEEESLNEDGGYVLAKKMKELEMMDVSDMEHVLDVEEALHYYSRLKSPVYVDIVDKFFNDMYTELSVPQGSVSTNSSKRRLGSIRL